MIDVPRKINVKQKSKAKNQENAGEESVGEEK